MRALAAILVILLSSCLGRQSGPVAQYTGQVVELAAQAAPDTVSLGRMREGETVAHEVMLHNNSDKNILVLEVDAGCGCTRVEFPRQPIKPGESAPLTVTFHSQGYPGEQMKTVNLRTSQLSGIYRLVVTAQVY